MCILSKESERNRLVDRPTDRQQSNMPSLLRRGGIKREPKTLLVHPISHFIYLLIFYTLNMYNIQPTQLIL